MLTSKQRADLRAQANDLDTTLMVGKGGVTENVLSEAARQLEARELVKGRVLEAALLSAREVCDALCEALGADGVQCVGSKFVIYRRSEKKAQEAARQARELKNINHRKGERRTWQISVYSAGASTRRIAAICWLQRSSSADLGWTASF